MTQRSDSEHTRKMAWDKRESIHARKIELQNTNKQTKFKMAEMCVRLMRRIVTRWVTKGDANLIPFLML